MSNNDIFDQPADMPVVDEMTLLRDRAKQLGIKVGPNIGIDSLRKRIQDHLDGSPSDDEDDSEEEDFENEETDKSDEKEDEDEVEKTTTSKKSSQKTAVPKKETIAEKIRRLRKEHLKLVRVRITCMNPAKKDMTGEFITIANKYIGKVSKFVPFNLEEPYHIPQVIYKELLSRRYVNVRSVRRGGVEVTQPESMREVPEFAIEVLPPLTEKELNNLKIQQAQSGSTVGD